MIRSPDRDAHAGWTSTDLGPVPSEWRIAEIGDLQPFVTSGSRGWARFYAESGSPFIRITNLSRDSIGLDLGDMKLVQLPPEAHAESMRTALRDGDLLISITADIGIVGLVDDTIAKPAYVNQHIALIRLDPSRASSQFVAYSLASERPQRLFLASMDVGAKAGMNLTTVRKIRLALPPLAEQRAIAAALSDADGLIEALEKLIAKKRAVKLAAMQQLLTGKTRLPGFSGEWGPRRLGDMGRFIPTANNPRSDLTEDGGLEYIHYGDVHGIETPFLDCMSVTLPRIMDDVAGSAAVLADGDLVMVDTSEDLEGVGKSVEIRGTEGKAVIAGLHTLAFRGYPDCWAHGFKGYLQFIPALKESLVRTATGISVYAISKRHLGDTEVRLPAAREQHAIATVLSDMDAEIAALEKRRDKAKQIKQGMMQALLTGRVRLVKPAEGSA